MDYHSTPLLLERTVCQITMVYLDERIWILSLSCELSNRSINCGKRVAKCFFYICDFTQIMRMTLNTKSFEIQIVPWFLSYVT